MSLLIVRTSPRPLLLHVLLLLLGVAVATATAHRGDTCRQEIPAELIRELWTKNKELVNKLPKEENSYRKFRLLPRFCVKCPERAIGWLEMQELMDVYQRSVFSREVVQKLLPLFYNDLLYRLQHTLQLCVSSSEPSRHFKTIKKLEKKLKKKNRDDAALKAVGEFTFILRWIDELAQHHVV